MLWLVQSNLRSVALIAGEMACVPISTSSPGTSESPSSATEENDADLMRWARSYNDCKADKTTTTPLMELIWVALRNAGLAHEDKCLGKGECHLVRLDLKGAVTHPNSKLNPS